MGLDRAPIEFQTFYFSHVWLVPPKWKPEPQDHCAVQCFLYQMRAKKGKFSLECDTCLKPALLEKVAFELCGKYIMVNNLLKHIPLKEAT